MKKLESEARRAEAPAYRWTADSRIVRVAERRES